MDSSRPLAILCVHFSAIGASFRLHSRYSRHSRLAFAYIIENSCFTCLGSATAAVLFGAQQTNSVELTSAGRGFCRRCGRRGSETRGAKLAANGRAGRAPSDKKSKRNEPTKVRNETEEYRE